MNSMDAALFRAFRHGLILACSLLSVQPLYSGSIYSQPYTFTTLAGSAGYGNADGTGANARFWSPLGSAVDSAGNVYVADTDNHTIRKITPAGVVSTLAGVAENPGSADGMGVNARFNQPTGVAVDSAGNLYVADNDNHTIRKITPAGEVSTLAGLAGYRGSADGTGANARFYYPSGVAVDSAGNVYVADTGNCTIRKITPTGEVSTLAGLAGTSGSANGTGATARFNSPCGVAVDSAGNVFVADSNNYTIRKVTPAGVVTTLAGRAGTYGSADGTGANAGFNYPYGVAVDSAGNVFVADTYNDTIRKVTPAGGVSTLAGLARIYGCADGTGSLARFSHPQGVAVDSAGNLYVADSSNHTIRKVTPAGVVGTLAGNVGYGSADGTGSAARFHWPAGVAVDSAGNVYAADTWNCTIRKVTPAGGVSTLAGLAEGAGGADGTGSAARFNWPAGVAVDSAGNVFVADTSNHTIRKVTPAGVVSTLAGLAGWAGSADGTGANAGFRSPGGVAVDSAGNVFVADTFNNTIRKVTPAGVVSTLAGLAGTYGSANGTGATARFNSPYGVAVDSAGNVFVADSGNDTIRKITPAGVVSTLAGYALTYGSADGTGSAARFNSPNGVAVDSAGNVFVVDSGNYTIRKITPAGAVTTLAGYVGINGCADGTGAKALFYWPYSVAVDSAGNLYVADEDNNTIRVGRAPAPPLLGISSAGGQLLLSWPLEASNFLVEASSTLLPAPVWLPLTNAVGTDGSRWVVTTSLEAGPCFFRLRLP